MHLFFASDENYESYLTVTIKSLLRYLGSEFVSIHVLDGGISRQSRQTIQSQVCSDLHAVEFYPCEAAMSTTRMAERHLSNATFLRLYIAELFPNLTRAIYLDIDICAFGSVRPLWEIDIGENCLGMVESPWRYYRAYKRRVGLTIGEPYYNAGVMLMNLSLLRDGGAARGFEEFYRRHGKICQFADQDIINSVMRGRILPLHPRWNVTTALFDWQLGDSLSFGASEVREAIRKPMIAHYTGARKPWNSGCSHRMANEWRRLVDEV